MENKRHLGWGSMAREKQERDGPCVRKGYEIPNELRAMPPDSAVGLVYELGTQGLHRNVNRG